MIIPYLEVKFNEVNRKSFKAVSNLLKLKPFHKDTSVICPTLQVRALTKHAQISNTFNDC